MKAMAMPCPKKKLPYNQQDKWKRPVENVLSVKQTNTEKKDWKFFHWCQRICEAFLEMYNKCRDQS